MLHRLSTGWRLISKKDGLLENQCAAFAIDKRGDVWYGYNADFERFSLIENPSASRPRFQHFRSGGEIGTSPTRFFGTDHRGWIWRGAPGGIDVADEEQARRGQWLHLTRSDGLPGTDANQRAFIEDRDGSVWFGMDNTIIHFFPPEDLVHPRYAPSVFISGFSWNSGPVRLTDTVNGIKSGAKVIAHIGSLQFDRPNALRFRYRLLPEQRSWKQQSDLDIDLGKLSWGNHRLEVQARLGVGPWSVITSKSFTVLIPIWLSWPLLAAYFTAISSFSVGGYVRHRRNKAASLTLPDLAAWRVGAFLPEFGEITGTLLDKRFEIGELLARGGFANVMAGYDREQGQPCVIKVFRSEVKDKAWLQHRFEQEVAALQKVRHPNVVSIYAHGSTAFGAPYLAMEFIEGKSLREILENGSLQARQTATILEQLASALDAIHAQGICHRDVKPENVILHAHGSPEEAAVLIDFSIAIVKDANEALHGLSRAAGTFEYMAPEQVIGFADSSSDIYSLSKVVIEMLTGRRLSYLLPDASIDLPDRAGEMLRSWATYLSDDSIHALASALAFDPSHRPHVAGTFAQLLVKDLNSGVQVRKT